MLNLYPLKRLSIFILLSWFLGLQSQSLSNNALGIGLNRYGIGFSYHRTAFQSSPSINLRKPLGWSLDLGNIQHPKEIAVVNTVFQNAGSYKLDKINYVWVLRPGAMYRLSLSERKDRRAIGVDLLMSPGIAAAYCWPVFVTTLQVDASGNEYFANVKYNPEVHKPTEIAGRSGFSEGFSQGSVIPALSLQGGFSFHWGNYRSDVNTLTLGARMDTYSKKLPILYHNAFNKSIFSSFYLNFAFGLGS